MRSASPIDRQAYAQASQIPVEVMYRHTLLERDQWGIDYYRTPKKYQSFQKDTLGRIGNFQKNSQKVKTYKKGLYASPQLREAAQVPSSAQYNLIKKWVQENSDEKQKLKQKEITPKASYIDELIKLNQKEPRPGPGQYNDFKSQFKPGQKQDIIYGTNTQSPKKDRSLPNLHRDNYIDEILFLAAETPGPGDYNPHDNIVKVKVNKHDHKFWISKHNSPSPVKNPQLKPGVGSYSPMSMTFTTFDQIAQEQKLGKNRPITRSKSPGDITYAHYGFGVEARFKNPQYQTKSKMIVKVPGPGTHNVVPHWPGKKDPVNGKQFGRNFYKFITTKPPEMSIYHEKQQDIQQQQTNISLDQKNNTNQQMQ